MNSLKPPVKFDWIHVLIALFLLKRHPMGRYQLAKEACLGVTSARTILKKLTEKGFARPLGRGRKGHVLTEKGKRLLVTLEKHIKESSEGNWAKEILVDEHGWMLILKKVNAKLTNGIAQRDEAIKYNASGATTLIYKDGEIRFPTGETFKGNAPFWFELKKQITEGDVLIFGSGKTLPLARLGAFAAASTLFPLDLRTRIYNIFFDI